MKALILFLLIPSLANASLLGPVAKVTCGKTQFVIPKSPGAPTLAGKRRLCSLKFGVAAWSERTATASVDYSLVSCDGKSIGASEFRSEPFLKLGFLTFTFLGKGVGATAHFLENSQAQSCIVEGSPEGLKKFLEIPSPPKRRR